VAGFAQSTGWPGVVTAVGNWFGKGKRGISISNSCFLEIIFLSKE